MARVLVITFAILLSGVSAGKADDRTPRPDLPGFWRSLTWFDATTSSTCIGRFEDPICTVETMLACWYRGRAGLCSAATQRPFELTSYRTENDWTRYRFIRVIRVTRHSQTLDHRELSVYEWRRNDLRLDIVSEDCWKLHCQDDLPGSYFLRWMGGRWKVVGWCATP